MSELTRRELLVAFGASGLMPQALAQQVHQAVRDIQSLDQGSAYTPQFFTPHEYATLRMLVDIIIPPDENSKGAIDAGAAEFIDYICSRSDNQSGYYRYGLSWIDEEMQRRTSVAFTDAAREEQIKLLDAIAFRKNSTALSSAGVDFFSHLRGMVVDAYYTSPVGMADVGYLGNRVLDSFSVPDEAVQYALLRSPA
jgi:gluconate 2-dehydrogenase gamma chain